MATVDRDGASCALGGTTVVVKVRPSGVLTLVAIALATRLVSGSLTEET
jgi:hypothetical protein